MSVSFSVRVVALDGDVGDVTFEGLLLLGDLEGWIVSEGEVGDAGGGDLGVHGESRSRS